MNRPTRPKRTGRKNRPVPKTNTLLVDGEVLLKRSFAGAKDIETNSGRSKTVFLFLDGLRRLVSDNNITKVVVCWEGDNSRTVRQQYYKYYKQNRDQQYTEEERYDLGRQRMVIRQCLEELFIRQVDEDYCEGDDVIAYYCLNSPNENKLIFTIDQDLLQLLSDDVRIYLSNKRQIIDRNTFIKLWGYLPENIPLYKTIVGDSADNISGVLGIGDKTFFTLYPEVKTDIKNVDWLLNETTSKLSTEPNNKNLNNILECVTKFGHHGREYHEVVYKIINLRQPLITDHAMTEVNEAISGVLDTQGRKGVQGVRELSIEFNFHNFFSQKDEFDLFFWEPFTMLIARERMNGKRNKEIL